MQTARPSTYKLVTRAALTLQFHSVAAAALLVVLTGCGGGSGETAARSSEQASSNQGSMSGLSPPSEAMSGPAPAPAPAPAAAGEPAPVADAPAAPPRAIAQTADTAAVVVPPESPTTTLDAVRLANQATFGATEPLVASIRSQGASAWIATQMNLPQSSQYTSGAGPDMHLYTGTGDYCDGKVSTCWRDNLSSEPLLWDFYRNAMTQPDQLRQRVAFALQQILVVNNLKVTGTYGLRNYYNNLMALSFANYRDVLKKVSLSPVMADFLDHANNSKHLPNENYARELTQLFSIGNCQLNMDGSLKGGQCNPTHDNGTVRSIAQALTGWTYPVGGKAPYGCFPAGANCRYYGGDMVPLESYHTTAALQLPSGYALAANHTAAGALEVVLDSLMANPNMPPFIGKQLIQHLVTSNPSPAYVSRVANAFRSGKFQSFGSGVNGDLSATVAAVLLDPEARGANLSRNAGKLREPVLMFTGVLRGLNGRTDGDALGWNWGGLLRQHVFRPPTVFNFYPPDYPVSGTNLVGPAFGIHGSGTALARLNFLQYLIGWNGTRASASPVPNPIGTQIDLSAFLSSTDDAAALVDRLSNLALGQPLPEPGRADVIKAVAWWTASRDPVNWRIYRAQVAAYLVYGSPNYQVQH